MAHLSHPLVVDNLCPLEALRVPSELDGQNGSNRAPRKHSQISADCDIDAVKAWLARYADNKATFDAYRKEAERLLLWCISQRGLPLSSLTHEDWLTYRRFLKNPQPQDRWMSQKGRKFARTDPNWRPFVGPLSESSQRQAGIIINALFSWLVSAGYLAGNPLALSRALKPRATPRVTRYLDEEIWLAVKASIESRPRETAREREHYVRLRWLFTLLYVGGLRISEVVGNSMGDFFRRRSGDGTEIWWLDILGKGDKRRLIPATSELMNELARYRRELGLSPYPTTDETTPLLLPIGGKKRALTRGGIHDIVKSAFKDTAARIRERGTDFEHLALRVERASAHWMRHTAGTEMANREIDLRYVRDNLGHESISTTNLYLHSSEDDRHAETESKHRVNW